MGTHTIILAVGKGAALLLLARATSAEPSSACSAALGQHCHSPAKSGLHLALLQAPCDSQEGRGQGKSPALGGRHHCASHYVCGFSIPFDSSPNCFQRQTLRDVESCPLSQGFFEKFSRKCYFLWKIWTFWSNSSMTKSKDFSLSLRISFFSKCKLGIFCKENSSLFSNLLDSLYFSIFIPL